MARTGRQLAIQGGVASLLLGGAATIALTTLSPGCGPSGDGDEGDAGENECFYALSADFENFTSWQHYHLDASFIPNNVHASGPRDVYINQCPDAGATEFPVGTIIVKVIGQPNQTVPGVFAQVKHGCGYNQAGASGWEWFDLLTPLNGGADAGPGNSVSILWQGLTPPASMSYGGDPSECNTCHAAMASDNDSIITPALQLKDIQCNEP
jgi:hypothetical protein